MKTLLAVAAAVFASASIGTTAAAAAACDNNSDTVLNRASGGTYHVCGTVDDGHRLYVYKGITYATGQRWEPPVATQPAADAVVTAKFFGAVCPQDPRGPFLTPEEEAKVDQTRDLNQTESEACLTLNVYAPQKKDDSKPWPVMLFIHGGAFITGTGTALDATGLARLGAVVVTFNYRLGALGFLTGTDQLIPLHRALDGNFGFLDQQMTMRWVFDNIDKFGGNKANITLFGESAGAMSVGLHTFVAPGSTSLFTSALMESNPLGVSYPLIKGAKTAGDFFIDRLCLRYMKATKKKSCPSGWMNKISACDIAFAQMPHPPEDDKCAGQLRPMITGVAAPIGPAGRQNGASANSSVLPPSVNLPWAPNVDGKIIVGQPVGGYATQIKDHKPIALGVNRDEGVAFGTIADLSLKALGQKLGPTIYWDTVTAAYGKQLDAIKAQPEYDPRRVAPLPNPDLDPAVAAFGNVLTDHDFVCGNLALARKLAGKPEKSKDEPPQDEPPQDEPPVFTYYFTQRPFFDIYLITAGGDAKRAADEGACAPLPNKEKPTGGKVCHANELLYVFNMMDSFTKEFDPFGYKPDNSDRVLASQMSNAWVDFATNPKSPAKYWKQFTTEHPLTPVWDQTSAATNEVNLDTIARCNIWLQTQPYNAK